MIKKILIALCFTWLGLVLGISFLEAPLKFQAPGITIKLGLGIGRLVFTALNRIEFVFMVLTLLAAFCNRRNKPGLAGILFISAIIVFQTFYLLPALDERAQRVLDGEMIPATFHHHLYIWCEVAKVITLLFTAIAYMNQTYSNENRPEHKERHYKTR